MLLHTENEIVADAVDTDVETQVPRSPRVEVVPPASVGTVATAEGSKGPADDIP